MTKEEIARALQGYHDTLIMMAETISANADKVGKPNYTFRHPNGEEMPKLDVLAEAVKNL